MGRKKNRQRPQVTIVLRPGESADEVHQHMKRWRKEMAFRIAQHPDLVEKARKLGIVLYDDDQATRTDAGGNRNCH